MKLFFSDQNIDEEHFHFWNHVHISQIGENTDVEEPELKEFANDPTKMSASFPITYYSSDALNIN